MQRHDNSFFENVELFTKIHVHLSVAQQLIVYSQIAN